MNILNKFMSSSKQLFFTCFYLLFGSGGDFLSSLFPANEMPMPHQAESKCRSDAADSKMVANSSQRNRPGISHTYLIMSSSEREPKRLRSSEPDLQVILGSGNDTSTHWCHSQSIALKSKYVDAMLSTPMREQETRTITFPDISLSLWNKNKFLDDPSAARKMTVEDVQNVAMLYDKYEFKLC